MTKITSAISKLPLYLFVLMLAGLLFSRALLSITTALWVVVIIISFNKEKLRKFKSLLVWSLTPVILFLLGLYQQPSVKENWDFLLTLLIYPVAAFSFTSFSELNDREKKAWIIFVIASLAYPLSIYALHFTEMNVLYGQGRSLPTLMDGDHVRYGLFLNATLLVIFLLKTITPRTRIVLSLIVVIAIVLMAVRTAWVGLFICLLMFIFFKQDVIKFNRWLLLLIIPIFAACYFLFPAVSQKIKYTIYDWNEFSPKTYNPDFSDGARRTVNHVAWKSISSGESNAGWAAVPSTLKKSFNSYFPNQQLDYGWPFNQWLYWCIASGWLGVLLFSVWLLYPIYYGFKRKNYFLITWTLIISASCIVESTLNLQYGVFLHAWLLAMFWIFGRQSTVGNPEFN